MKKIEVFAVERLPARRRLVFTGIEMRDAHPGPRKIPVTLNGSGGISDQSLLDLPVGEWCIVVSVQEQ